jgi:hypothetical protein
MDIKAKTTSHLSMIAAGLWIMILTVLKGLKKISLSENDIIYSGVAVAAVFSPVYFSILMDKIKDIKLGNPPENEDNPIGFTNDDTGGSV